MTATPLKSQLECVSQLPNPTFIGGHALSSQILFMAYTDAGTGQNKYYCTVSCCYKFTSEKFIIHRKLYLIGTVGYCWSVVIYF